MSVITCIDVECLPKLRQMLDSEGFHVVQLDGEYISDACTFYEQATRILPLDPPIVGAVNWDAFVDSVWGGLDDLGEQKVAVVWTRAENMLRGGLQDLLEIVLSFQHLASLISTREYGIQHPVRLLVLLVGKGDNFRIQVGSDE